MKSKLKRLKTKRSLNKAVKRWNVTVNTLKKTPKLKGSVIAKVAKKVLNDSVLRKKVAGPATELGITITTDKTIRKLNREYRGKDKATDVLSFSYLGGCDCHEHAKLFGDLVISIETTVRQAKEQDVNLYQELLRLIIHGLLHLAGYDHEYVPKKEAQKMRKLEKRLYWKYLAAARQMTAK